MSEAKGFQWQTLTKGRGVQREQQKVNQVESGATGKGRSRRIRKRAGQD